MLRSFDTCRSAACVTLHLGITLKQARLIPAVEHFCQSRGLHYRRIPDQGTGHVGVIDVSLAGVGALSVLPEESGGGGGGYDGYANGGAGVDVGWGGGSLGVSFQQQQQQRHNGVGSGNRL